MSKKVTCYACDGIATSKEHVPPRSFFPPSYRKNLITVPSCDIHNSEKSKNDGYLRSLIAIYYENNLEGQLLFSQKVMRSLKRRPNLIKRFFFTGDVYPALINGKPSMAFSYDSKRLEETIACIAKAIYYHHFQMKWTEQLQIIPASAAVSPKVKGYEVQNAWLAKLKSMEFETLKFGENQDIFYYQFLEDANNDFKRLRMVFYQGFVAYALPVRLLNSLTKRDDS